MEFIDKLNITTRKWNSLFKDFYIAWLLLEDKNLNIAIGSNLRTILEEIVNKHIPKQNKMSFTQKVNQLEKEGELNYLIATEMRNSWGTLSDSAHSNKDKYIFDKMWKPVINVVLIHEKKPGMTATEIENPFTDEYKDKYKSLLNIGIPVEKIKEVIKEVKVEVIKEIPKYIDVIKEVPIEKIVEVVREVPIEIIKEIPVEKIVEVIKEVPVEHIADKTTSKYTGVESLSDTEKMNLLSQIPVKTKKRNYYNNSGYFYDDGEFKLGDKLKRELSYNIQYDWLGLGYRKVSGTKIGNYTSDYIFGSLFNAYLAKVGVQEKPIQMKYIDAGRRYENDAVKFAFDRYYDKTIVCNQTGEVYKYNFLKNNFDPNNSKSDSFFDYYKYINKFVSGRPDAIIMVDKNVYNPLNILIEAKTTNIKRRTSLEQYGASLAHILQAEMYAYFMGIEKFVISYLLLEEEDYKLGTKNFDDDRFILFEYEVDTSRIEKVISKIKMYDKLWRRGESIPVAEDIDVHLERYLNAEGVADHVEYLLHKKFMLDKKEKNV